MTTTIIILISILIILTLISIGLAIHTIHRNTVTTKNTFEIQLASAKANKLPDIHKMAYSDLMKIVNDTIDYYTTRDLSLTDLTHKSSEEISLILDDIAADIATKVKVGVSPHVSECITCYIADEFYDRYIINSVRMLLIAYIEKNRRSKQRNIYQNNTTQQPKTVNSQKR